MQFQRSHISIVRSIRQVSLVRDWFRARSGRAVPTIASFEPNERAGDALDLLLCEVVRSGDGVDFRCLKAGERVGAIYDAAMTGRTIRDCLDPAMAEVAMPIWKACVAAELPIFAIVPVSDMDGCPVTIELLLLPYAGSADRPDFIVVSLHACSTERRFSLAGLMRVRDRAPPHWAVVIDPAATAAPRPAELEVAAEQIVMDVI
ncbi:PAS domain-containing protein [Bradyrhizobium sp. 2TAF24]|uniref:PAS domain-containing protein n=1 Tax=Bradyrhizobium sp. 2TAF24 TaxID=3233011 RepID=UPI003F92101A